MIRGNNILLGEILRNFAALEKNVEELKYLFNPAKLLMKTPTELNNFNTTYTNINKALEDCKKFLE